MTNVIADLHRHVGGALTPKTLQTIISHHGGKMSLPQIRKQLLFKKNEKRTFTSFLAKFNILDEIKWDNWSIQYAIRQIIWNIAGEGINYCELKLSIGRYMKDTNWTPEDILTYIREIINDEERKWDIKIGLALCLKYEWDKKLQKRIAKIIDTPKSREAVNAIDLVGNEQYFDHKFYKPIFKVWGEAKKGLQAHVGESQSEENVQLAIEHLGINRIAHGIKIAGNINLMKMVKERDICMDLALTSNLYTGVVKDIHSHPIRELFDYGIPITLGTDDPVILNTNLKKEFQLAKDIGFTPNELLTILGNSQKYKFS
jgi:adenosine deaminase